MILHYFLLTLVNLATAGEILRQPASSDVQIVPGKKTLTVQQINGALAKHTGEFAKCVETGSPSQGGTLRLSFLIGSNGKVRWAKKVESDLSNESQVSCIVNVVKKVRFAKLRGRSGTEVKSYPFFFHSDAPAAEPTH